MNKIGEVDEQGTWNQAWGPEINSQKEDGPRREMLSSFKLPSVCDMHASTHAYTQQNKWEVKFEYI